ncbi:hypothetical protein [Microbacterium caowuchunii]|uniref:Uncharacterized protein n=1 Tax=Microbacterium caowuchunii TaxID=2614638 RepID=A0A5N0TNM7_9MICO|nr:hypothetical protein [Microbacterium caowuchunii]KAA9135878.1 hypothetical protein F6B40_01470 [Microbacterium caowuchunii]
MKLTRIAACAVLAAAALSLAACATSAAPAPTASSIGGDVIAPVTMAADDLQGATVDLLVGQVLNITTGDLAVDSYTGQVADAEVATFVEGRTDGSAEFNPGVEAVGAGTTDVTMTNSDGGIQPLRFTVVVTEK